MEFPRIMTKVNGKSKIRIHVDSQEQYDEKLGQGWFGSVTEARAAALEKKASAAPSGQPEDVKSTDGAPTRAELVQKATELGLNFPKNVKTSVLAAAIEEAIKAQG